MEPGKLFVGGISWDTNEDRLREYFQSFGEVLEAVIMKDRNTGRARGFGFIIYADPSVADIVVQQKHVLDGRTVEAKKAVPRDDQQIMNKSGNINIHGSPGPVRTKKIFVGGLPSTIKESDFKCYFDQFGLITDVVVMYDHNTQRPRGFGFITFDSEEAVERVLFKTFHEVNGKMVEVKRAVPKELSPGAIRPQLGGNYGLNRVSSFLNMYNPSLVGVGGLGLRMDERHSPVSLGRSVFPSFGVGPLTYGSPLTNELRMSPNNREGVNLMSAMGYERGLNPMYGGGNAKWNENFTTEYDGTDRASNSSLNSTSWSLWGNGSNTNNNNNTATYPNNSSSSLNGFRYGNNSTGALNRIEAIWGSSPVSGQTGGSNSPNSNQSVNLGLNHADNILAGGSLFSAPNGGLETNNFQGLYGGSGGGGGGGLSWLSSSPELNGSASYELGLGNATAEVPHKNPGLCW